MLLLHGWPDDADLWRHQVPALTGAGFRVIAPDLRGFGRLRAQKGKDNLQAGPAPSPTWRRSWTPLG